MYLKKAQAGSAPGHTWTKDGDVVEVPDDLAEQLLLIPNGGFSEALPPQPKELVTPDPEEEPLAPQGPSEDEEPPKPRRGRPPKNNEVSE